MRIISAKFSPNLKYIVSYGEKELFLWCANSGKIIFDLSTTLMDKIVSVTFSKRGNMIIVLFER